MLRLLIISLVLCGVLSAPKKKKVSPPISDPPASGSKAQPDSNAGGSSSKLEEKMAAFVVDLGDIAPFRGHGVGPPANTGGQNQAMFDFPDLPPEPSPPASTGSKKKSKN